MSEVGKGERGRGRERMCSLVPRPILSYSVYNLGKSLKTRLRVTYTDIILS